MPPRHGKKLADVMDEAFRNNSNAVDDVDTEGAQGHEQSEAPAASLNRDAETVPAPAKTAGKIKGYPGQSTLRTRVSAAFVPRRYATALQAPAARIAKHCIKNALIALAHLAGDTLASFCFSIVKARQAKLHPLSAGRQTSRSSSPEIDNASAEPVRTKRKQAAKVKQIYTVEGGDDEGASNPVLKKRRVSGDARASALKDVAELESAIKKLQSSVTKDLKHLMQLTVALTAQLNEMD
ncbi:hypothetical protein C0989_009561 [Termitomyces sp. Mn162]|nr:hypothetical protein C0989_009561 [Termitomyces sp. Mn162]